MRNSKAVQDWLRVHRLLMDKEAAFTELAMQAAAGEIAIEVLDEERRALMTLRAHCTVVYEAAFPRLFDGRAPGLTVI